MKKKLLRLSKKILILMLCTTLISGSVVNRYKITANAAAMALGAGAAYEICIFIAECFLAAVGVCAAGEAIYQNRDKLAEFGKEVIDSCSFDDAPDWVIHKATAAGQQQVYGREVFDYIRAMTLTAVLAGGSSPQNNNDDDDDEPESAPDVDPEESPDVSPEDSPTAEELYDARTMELDETSLMAAQGFLGTLATAFAPLIDGISSGEENILTDVLGIDMKSNFSDYEKLGSQYVVKISWSNPSGSTSYVVDSLNLERVFLVASDNNIDFYSWVDNGWKVIYLTYTFTNSITGTSSNTGCGCNLSTLTSNVPVFASADVAANALRNNDFSSALNYAKVYQIADWVQEDWSSALGTLHGGVHSLTSRAAIIGEAANQAFQNQLDGKGYIEALEGAVAATAPLPLPGTMAEPEYVPDSDEIPKLGPDVFPWSPGPVPVPEPDPEPDSGGLSDDDIRGRDSFGINTLFGIIILLIMILLMLLMIFLSCLAFIIMIFRIPATTGFLPPDMVAGLDYLKTLEIVGFGMSVYDFFMSLIYIILIFTVIGILRKNIDKIKFPRKGRW